jgi:hypothetical protein
MHRAGQPRAEAGREHTTLHSPPPASIRPPRGSFVSRATAWVGAIIPPARRTTPFSKGRARRRGSIKRAERHQTQAVRRWSGRWVGSGRLAPFRGPGPSPAFLLGTQPDRKPGTSGRARARPTNPRTSAGQWAADRASAPWSPNRASAGEVRTLSKTPGPQHIARATPISGGPSERGGRRAQLPQGSALNGPMGASEKPRVLAPAGGGAQRSNNSAARAERPEGQKTKRRKTERRERRRATEGRQKADQRAARLCGSSPYGAEQRGGRGHAGLALKEAGAEGRRRLLQPGRVRGTGRPG